MPASKFFTFTYTYSNGDFYQGRGYINSSDPAYNKYYVGYNQTYLDESKNYGTYKITSVSLSTDESKNKFIYVDKYYDKESNAYFTPVSVGKAISTSGLGTEKDYIIAAGKSCFAFGLNYGYIYEADVSSIYSFSYTFGNGDYYTGTVYAKPTYGYYYKSSTDYYKTQLIDENGQMGTYKITGMKGYYDHSMDGKVIINQYYNSENKTLYHVQLKSYYGSSYLKSESGWIIRNNVPQFYFGYYNGKIYEADVGSSNRYTFSYTYSNGDYYNGFVYAPASKGYYVGYTKNLIDEHGKLGTYKITGVTSGYDSRRNGQVYVDRYYDAEGNKSFTPVGFRWPETNTPVDNLATGVGLSYLGSEKDYIIRTNVPEYFFGYSLKNGSPVISEADLVWVEYNFKYTYGNGDYYTGRVWARMDYGYFPGYAKAVQDENGGTGKYYISSSKYLADPTVQNGLMGRVYVDSYYDKEANAKFTPVSAGEFVGTEYLGSEADYILQAGQPEFYFGGGYNEADVSCAYSFKYTYGNGDYYTGTVYAPPGYSNTASIKDENGLYGRYSILSISAYVDSSRNGRVYVSRYYDTESKKMYTPVSNYLAAGTKYLGSETGFIYATTSSLYRFGYYGGKYYEADRY